MDKSRLKSAVVFPFLLVCSFGWGYLAASDRLFPFSQIEAAKAYVAARPEEGPEPPSYWLERKSFFDAFGTRAAVVMIGDSLTDGAEWAEMFPGAAVVNRGIDGDTTAGVLRRMEGIRSVHARKAFVMMGINDFGVEGRSVDAVFGDYRRIVRQLEASGMKVFIQSTLQCNEAKAVWISCPAIRGKIERLNRRLAGLASGNVAFVDINAGLAGEGGLRPELSYDGVHLNGKGYQIWKGEISKLVMAD